MAISPPLLKKSANASKILDGFSFIQEREAIAAILSHSPYLTGIIRRHSEWVDEILSENPHEFHNKLIGEINAFESDDETEISNALRVFKRKSALFLSLNDLLGRLPCMEVTRCLTQYADLFLQKALDFTFKNAIKEGLVTHTYSGIFVIAMGKMGAFELNFSSDIDLIIFFDPEKLCVAPHLEINTTLEKISKRFVSLIQNPTSEGYVHRVDVRLRPDPSSTPIIIPTTQAFNYYEHIGQTWERSAFIKARICAGDFEAGNAFLKELSPFVFRKYMDFKAINEIHEMKEAINAFKGSNEISLIGHNLKLGRGGIREIEFFVQAQQLLGGGRILALRNNQTLQALDNLVLNGWVKQETAESLEAAYLFLRQAEHRLQMLHDEQTHSLPQEKDALESFARFCGFNALKDFQKVLIAHLKVVEKIYLALFQEKEAPQSQKSLDFASIKPKGATLSSLIEWKFTDPPTAYETMKAWKGALKSQKLKEELFAFLPTLLTAFSKAGEPDLSLMAFDKLISKSRHPFDLLSLLKQDTQMTQLFALTLAAAPRLSKQIMQRAHILDGLLEPAFKGEGAPLLEVIQNAKSFCALAQYEEELLDRLRIFMREQHFLTAIKLLNGSLSLSKTAERFSALADCSIEIALEAAQKALLKQHGIIPNAQIAIIALGKCGAREMNATSDLDLLILYDYADDNAQSDGEKPISAQFYYTKLTQKLISLLTVQTSEGGLYEVDFRLRPSGNKGPVATRLSSFKEYHAKEAWVWEAMALTKARVITATEGFEKQVQKIIRAAIIKKRENDAVKTDIIDMRQMIADEHGDDTPLDFKQAKGGLIDIEFIAQYLQLTNASLANGNTLEVLEAAKKSALLERSALEILIEAYRFQSLFLQMQRASFEEKDEITNAFKTLLLKALHEPQFSQLLDKLKEMQTKTRDIFNHVFH